MLTLQSLQSNQYNFNTWLRQNAGKPSSAGMQCTNTTAYYNFLAIESNAGISAQKFVVEKMTESLWKVYNDTVVYPYYNNT